MKREGKLVGDVARFNASNVSDSMIVAAAAKPGVS
jgi:hypothetical protein